MFAKLFRFVLPIVALPLLGTPADAFDAVVTSCVDGDTCTVIASEQRIHIRLHGVDAPELDQPYGPEARDILTSLIVGHHVDVRAAGHSYNRMVADLVREDGLDTATELVADGAARVEPQFNTNPELPGWQVLAQQSRLGLWADAAAIPPWVAARSAGASWHQLNDRCRTG
jgi:endonuclease YncB( thermonuclease family)